MNVSFFIIEILHRKKVVYRRELNSLWEAAKIHVELATNFRQKEKGGVIVSVYHKFVCGGKVSIDDRHYDDAVGDIVKVVREKQVK